MHFLLAVLQDALSKCEYCEDVVSMALTVVKSLLEEYNVKTSEIGKYDHITQE